MIIIYDDARTLSEEALRKANGVFIVDKERNTFRILKHRYEVIDPNKSFPFGEITSMIRGVFQYHIGD